MTHRQFFVTFAILSVLLVGCPEPPPQPVGGMGGVDTGGSGGGGIDGGGGAAPVCKSDAECAFLVMPCHIAACDLTGTITDPGSPIIGCGVRPISGQPCSKNGKDGTCTVDSACCTGCIDSSGHCRSGTFAGACGAAGITCQQCAAGHACSNAGSCFTNCATPGAPCTGGVLGNGPDGQCVCCKGCFDADGYCVDGTAQDMCGVGGVFCQNCGAHICSQWSCK